MKRGKRASSNNKSFKIIRNILIILVVVILIFILSNYIIFDKNKKINLIINNRNITSNMKNDVVIKDDVIYLSKLDIQNFFDKHIYEVDNLIVTTYDEKIAEIGFDDNEIEINGKTQSTKAHARVGDDGEKYLPISEMKDVYGIDIEYHDKTKVVTIDSTDREQKQCTLKNNVLVKSSSGIIGKTVAKAKKGSNVIKVNETKNNKTLIRTEDGKLGYVKSKNLENEKIIRQAEEPKKQIENKVNMFWDYFSMYSTAPDRSGSSFEGINVVSPSFFYLDEEGNLKENIGNEGKKYIKWAHDNGYKVWPMVQNTGENMIDVTSQVMNDYQKRKELIESIEKACVENNLDGINIDFENMKQEDIDLYSRFIIELTPRIKEIGDVVSVDVTAPDGGETWSMCFDRNVIGDVADYIVFMAYDQYGISSTKAGTTAGYNWVKLSLEKLLKTEEIKSDKILLAIPFYTRLWAEGSDGKATSTVVNMKDVERILPNGVEKQWDNDLKQNYIEYINGNTTMKMWIEDVESIKEKISLIPEYNLGGVAEWQKDMEDNSIWKIIDTEINK